MTTDQIIGFTVIAVIVIAIIVLSIIVIRKPKNTSNTTTGGGTVISPGVEGKVPGPAQE